MTIHMRNEVQIYFRVVAVMIKNANERMLVCDHLDLMRSFIY